MFQVVPFDITQANTVSIRSTPPAGFKYGHEGEKMTSKAGEGFQAL